MKQYLIIVFSLISAGGDRDSGVYVEDQDDSPDGDNSHSPVSPSDSPIFCKYSLEAEGTKQDQFLHDIMFSSQV